MMVILFLVRSPTSHKLSTRKVMTSICRVHICANTTHIVLQTAQTTSIGLRSMRNEV